MHAQSLGHAANADELVDARQHVHALHQAGPPKEAVRQAFGAELTRRFVTEVTAHVRRLTKQGTTFPRTRDTSSPAPAR